MSGGGNRDLSGLRFSLGSPFFGFVWKPEGLLLTPRSSSAPYGYGFPKRNASSGTLINPPFGTKITNQENECLNQVLINKFFNNKYLDLNGFIQGLDEKIEIPETNDRLRSEVSDKKSNFKLPIVFWPLFYTPETTPDFWITKENQVDWIDLPGVNQWSGGFKFTPKKRPKVDNEGDYILPIEYRQFDSLEQSLIYESESFEWFCHWPQELLYNNDAFEAIFQKTNAYRSAGGKNPVTREIRGFANMSRMIVSEIQRAHVQYHNDESRYRSGYQTIQDRLFNAGSNYVSAGENLSTTKVAFGFSWDSGVTVAEEWKKSPIHYANMMSDLWSTPKGSTSLDVFGNVSTTITESGITAGGPVTPFNPPFSGKSWSQVFVKRDRWLYAGTVEHKTRYGTLTTQNFQSPVGRPTSYPGGAAYIFHHGRMVFVEAIHNIEQSKDTICRNYGAVLYMESGVLSYRVIFGWWESNGTNITHRLSACHRSVHAHHEDWTIESTFDTQNEEAPFMSCFWFDFDGISAITTMPELLTTKPFSFYFNGDVPTNAVPMFPVGARKIHYDSGSFSLGSLIEAPNIVYTMLLQNSNLDHYNYKQEGSGTFNITPFIDRFNNLDYIQYEMNHLIDQYWTSDTLSTTEVNINDTLIFPSGTRLQIRKFNFTGEANVNNWGQQYQAVDDMFFLSFFYFNPVTEEVIYAKHTVTFNFGTYVQTSIYYNDTLIKSYPNIQLTTLIHTAAFGVEKATDPNAGEYAKYALSASRFLVNTGGPWTIPPWFGIMMSDGQLYISESFIDYPNQYGYVSKAFVGTYPASIGSFFGQNSYSTEKVISGIRQMNSGYNVGIPYVYSATGEGLSFFARYKDRFAFQLQIDNLWGLMQPDFTAEDLKIIYANFPLDDEVDIGTLTDIFPLGVIYGDSD